MRASPAQVRLQPRPIIIHAVVIAFYAGLALVLTYPLIAQFTTHFAGLAYSDAPEMARHVWWFRHALQTGQSLTFQPLLAYPNGLDGSILAATPLQFFPAVLFAFFVPLPAALNLHVLVALTLNGCVMFRLARALIGTAHGSALPAVLAGAVYMLFPTMQGHLGAAHIGIIAQWGVPLYALGLLRLTRLSALPGIGEPDSVERTGQARFNRPVAISIGLTAAAFFIASLGHTPMVLYALAPLTAVWCIALIVRRRWRALVRVLIAAGSGALVLFLFLLPILESTLNNPVYTDGGGIVRYSADLLAPITPSFQHPIWGQLEYTHRVLGINIDEGAAYIGIVPSILGVIGAIRFKAARVWVFVAGVAVVLSFGTLLKVLDQPVTLTVGAQTTTIPMPYALIADLPFVSLARTPGRFNLLTALAVAALSAFGAAWLHGRLARLPAALKTALFIGLIGLILFDVQVFFPFATTNAVIPDAVYALSARDDVRAVLDVPVGNLIVAKRGMYLQTAHQHPLIAGHITRETPVDAAFLAGLQQTLDSQTLAQAGADVVIIHREYDERGELEARARQQLGEPIFQDSALAIFTR